MITPGEWVVSKDSSGCPAKLSIETPEGYFIAQVDGGIGQEDNARLIASAPNLLEAAQEAMRLIDLLEIISKDGVEIYKHELRGDVELYRKRILPAIQKAKGENND